MAIYHFSVQVIGRKAGRSAVAAAAYRAGERLHDERLDRDHDFRARAGVEHSEIILPENAPEEWRDRERLWNDVEAIEVRKDAQLAREVEFAIPRKMSKAEGIELARDFVQTEFVDRGMVADLNVHWDIGVDGQPKPHAHVMLTLREATPGGFGQKVREWNDHENVERWRERWADHVNLALAELDIDARIDHRSLEAQGIELEPQSKIGGPAQRMERDGLEADRAELHREIARENGKRIIANPGIPLDAITHQQATFTHRDMAMSVHRHSDGQDQFNAATSAVRGSPDLIALGKDGRGEDRLTSREMIEVEQRLQRAVELMAERERHATPEQARELGEARRGLNGLRQHAAVDAEQAYARDASLVPEAARGDTERARQAIVHEREVRTDPSLRADRFVERWNRLSKAAERAYVAGDYDRRRLLQDDMRGMAKSLERDPQMESILANRKQQLGISFDTGRKLGAELAFHEGIDLGRGRGIGR